jgi:hypothetical protein
MMMEEMPNIKVERIILEKIKFGVGIRLPQDAIRNMTLEQSVDFVSRDIVLRFETFLLGRKVREEIKEQQVIFYSWWDFFKARHCPIWFIKRFPIKQHLQPIVINHYHICPHTGIMMNPNRIYEEIEHLEFLKGIQEERPKE